MSKPTEEMETSGNKESRKRRRSSITAELARFCIEEFSHNSTRELTLAYLKEVENSNGQLLTAAAAAAISTQPPAIQPAFRNRVLPTSTAGSSKSIKVSDLLVCPDEEFDAHINVTRRTIKTLYDAMKLDNKDFRYNDFLLLIWYLSTENSSPSKAAEVFEIEDENEILPQLISTSSKLKWLFGSAKMELPKDEYGEDEIVESFKRRTELPNIMGALGVMRLDCLDGTRLNVLAIVDHERNFRHISLSNNFDLVQDVVRNSPVYERLLQDHPKHYTFLCPSNGYPSLPQLIPGLRHDEVFLFNDMSDEITDLDRKHNEVVSYIRTAIKEAVSRFPKLNSLETASTEIVMAAFMLHNFCNQLRDISIYNFDATDPAFNGSNGSR